MKSPLLEDQVSFGAHMDLCKALAGKLVGITCLSVPGSIAALTVKEHV